jgi:zinc transporter, ZIP family
MRLVDNVICSIGAVDVPASAVAGRSFVDSVVIGIGSTLDLLTGLIMALGLGLSIAPWRSSPSRRRCARACRRSPAAAGEDVRGRADGWRAPRFSGAPEPPLELRMVLVALASGFLITSVVQGIIPEANREGEPGFAGVLYIGRLSLDAQMSLALK